MVLSSFVIFYETNTKNVLEVLAGDVDQGGIEGGVEGGLSAATRRLDERPEERLDERAGRETCVETRVPDDVRVDQARMHRVDGDARAVQPARQFVGEQHVGQFALRSIEQISSNVRLPYVVEGSFDVGQVFQCRDPTHFTFFLAYYLFRLDQFSKTVE